MDKFICECGKEFSSYKSLTSHGGSCQLYVKKKKKKTSKYKNNNNEYICECGKIFTYYQSFNAHLSHCDVHHEKTNKIRKKRPNELNHSMNWGNKSKEEIKKIRNKSGKTYSQRIQKGIIKPAFLGKTHSELTKEKIRYSTIRYIESLKGICKARYNKKSIEYINLLNELNGWHLQHAENGGEVNIGGYFVDGYDSELNIVFEYDEPKHYKNVEESILNNKDVNRQNFIINKTGCKFYRYNEKMDYLYEII